LPRTGVAIHTKLSDAARLESRSVLVRDSDWVIGERFGSGIQRNELELARMACQKRMACARCMRLYAP
jgi:hypothetical protein